MTNIARPALRVLISLGLAMSVAWDVRADGEAIDALAYGFATGAAAAGANTALLDDACAERSAIIWPAGDFYFNMITGITSTTSAFDQIAWKGAASEYAWQHQEEGGQGDKQLTRFVLVNMGPNAVWLDMLPRAATRIGPWRIEDITFQIPTGHQGSVFRIGNPSDANPVGVSIRGLNVKGCYFTSEDHPAGSYLVQDGVNGWVINRPYGRNFAWQVTKGYDIAFEDTSIRGFYTNEFRHCDRFLARNWRGGVCGRVIDVYGIPGANAPVPAVINGLWSEGHWVVGANLESCEVHGLNAESGYLADYEPNIGERDHNNDNPPLGADANPNDDDPRRLPATISWSLSAATAGVSDNSILLSGFGAGRDATHYFEPRTVIRVEPEEANEPARFLYIDSVDADEIFIRNSSTTSYIHAAISGDGERITRWFGTGVNLVGDKTAVFGHNVHVNHILGDFNHDGVGDGDGDFPLGFIVPGTMPTVVSGGVEGLTANSIDDTTRWAVVADDYGIQFRHCGGVRWIGPEAPDHPLVLKDGDPHLEWDPNTRSMEIERLVVPREPAMIRHRAFPGRGVAVANNVAQLLRFRDRSDPKLGRFVWVHDLGDSPSVGWQIPGLSRAKVDVHYVIRFFAEDATASNNDFTIDGDSAVNGTEDQFLNQPQGWHTVTDVLDASQMHETDAFVRLSGRNIQVAWAEFFQDEEE